MPTGLGDEQLWLCPTLDDSATNLGASGTVGSYVGNMATVSDTSNGGARAYDGTTGIGDYVSIVWPNYNGTTRSVSAWMKDVNFHYSNSNMPITGQVQLGSYGNSIDFVTPITTGPWYVAYDAAPYATYYNSTWHCYTFVQDPTNTLVYVDGVLYASYATNAFTGDINGLDEFHVGNERGYIDDFRVFDRALTQAEVAHLAEARGITGSPPQGLGDEQLWLCPSINNSPNDISGNGNNGVYQGGLSTIADVSNGGSLAYDFDGVDDKISVANSASIQDLPAGDYSSSIWIKPDTSGGSGLGELFNKGYETGVGWELMIRDVSASTNAIQFSEKFPSADNYGWTTSNAVALSAWQHVVYTFENSTKTSKIYVNGVEVANDTDVNGSGTYATDSANTLYVGARADNVRNFDGLIDDARIFTRAITQAEITHLASQRGIEGTPPVGLGDEKLWISATNNNTGTATAFNDLSGEGNDGTATGTTVTADAHDGGTYAYNMSATTTSRIALPASFDSTIFSDNTVCGWFKYTGLIFNADNDMALIGPSSTSSQWYSAERTNSSGGPTGSYRTYADDGSNNGSSAVTGTGNEEDNAWHHVAFVRDYTANTGTFYLDGVSLGSAAFTSNELTATQDLFIGYSAVGGRGYAGDLSASGESLYFDDIRAYNRTLTPAEVTHLASQRGVLGTPFEGLGDEQLWLCPSLQDGTNDLSGNNNDGVYLGNAATVADTSAGGSRAYNTSSAGDLIKCVYQGTDSFSGWFYTSAANRGASTSMFTGTNVYSGASWGDGLYWDNTTIYVKANNTTGGWVNLPSGSVPSGTWFHYASVRTASGMSYYVNGVRVQTAATSTTDRGDLFIGNSAGTSPLGDFRSDDIRAYTRELTQAEITHLAEARGIEGPAPVGLGDEKLWLCPSLNDSANDISGNGNNGAYQNGMATVADTGAGGSRSYHADAVDQTVLVSGFGQDLSETTTISLWVKSINPWVCVPVAQGGLGYSTSIWQYAVFNSGTTRILRRRSANLSFSSPSPSDQWQHICIVRETGSSTQEVYIDGVLDVSSASNTATYGTNQLWFGFGNSIGVNEEIYLDDMRTYGRVLNQSEITHLATSRGIEGSPSTPTAQYNAFATHAFKQLFQQRLR